MELIFLPLNIVATPPNNHSNKINDTPIFNQSGFKNSTTNSFKFTIKFSLSGTKIYLLSLSYTSCRRVNKNLSDSGLLEEVYFRKNNSHC